MTLFCSSISGKCISFVSDVVAVIAVEPPLLGGCLVLLIKTML